MKTALRLIAAVGFSCCLSTLWAYTAPHLLAILLAAMSFIALASLLIACSIIGWVRWRHESPYWATPALACFISLLIAWFTPAIGPPLADRLFVRRLPEYQRAVEEVRNNQSAIAPEGDLVVVTVNAMPRGVRSVRTAQCQDGTIVVEFLLDTRVILLHDGYVYQTHSENEPCLNEAGKGHASWPYLRHVKDHWYHFSDQPGL
jgi:hypothetical protein